MIPEKRLYVAATSQNDGKTTVCLGLIEAFRELKKDVAFIKPVGQRYLEVEGFHIDEDSWLIRQACGMKCKPKHMSPITVERGFTKRFLDHADGMLPLLEQGIRTSFDIAARDKEVVVIEGTGHAGVGSTFGLCNADVARLLGAKVIMVVTGGIGRPLDEVALNRALFREKGVPLVGVIVNKVLPEKLEEVRHYLSRGLAWLGLELRGIIPYVPRLTWPTVRQIMDELHYGLVCGEARLDDAASSVLVGAMSVHNALRYLHKGALVITPSDREDFLCAVVTAGTLSPRMAAAGIVLTGGITLRSPALGIIRRAGIPVLVSRDHTYKVASDVHQMVIKIRHTDVEKVLLARELVRKYVDVGAVWKSL